MSNNISALPNLDDFNYFIKDLSIQVNRYIIKDILQIFFNSDDSRYKIVNTLKQSYDMKNECKKELAFLDRDLKATHEKVIKDHKEINETILYNSPCKECIVSSMCDKHFSCNEFKEWVEVAFIYTQLCDWFKIGGKNDNK